MNWYLLALAGQLSNSVAFTVDKILLKTAFQRAATYAGLVGILSFLVVIFFPFAKGWPTGSIFLLSFASGSIFIGALWAFYGALSRGEFSRVVPVVGVFIPLFTLLGTFTFLGERLGPRALVGFALLVAATLLLSYAGGKGKLKHSTVWLALLAAALFAASSVMVKGAYDVADFWGTFIVSRLGAAITALLLVSVFDRPAGHELLGVIWKSEHRKDHGTRAAVLAFFGQSMGSVGFVLIQAATAAGSAAIVNAMQAVQYAVLVVIGLVFHHKFPKLLDEEVSRRVILIKSAALVLVAIGLYLIV